MQQRSSILFWPLLAATIAVDAVVCNWASEASLQSVEQLYYGLACGQVSVATIGAYFTENRSAWRWLLPFAAVALATIVTTWIVYEPISVIAEFAAAHVALWLIQALGVLVGLWALDHTRLADRWRSRAATKRVQFSIKHLLIATTLLAAFLVACRLAKFQSLLLVFIVFAANNAAIAIVAVICHSLPWHFILRWAAFAAVVLVLAYVAVFLAGGGDATGINAYQAFMVALWLTIGGIGPQRVREVFAESTAQRPLDSST